MPGIALRSPRAPRRARWWRAGAALTLLGGPGILAATLGAQSPSRAALALRIDSIVQAPIARAQVVGAAIAVVRGADTIARKEYGKANLELNVPTPPGAIYEIGSVTKQFTGAAILQLVEQGKLSLDDDVTKYVPQFNARGRRITIRRLLDHSSGMRGYTEMPEAGAILPLVLPRDTILRLIEKYPYDFEPGDDASYNNSAFFLAGLVIEKASGMSYAEYVQRHLFAPAGMTASHYCSESEVRPNKTSGYDWGGARGAIQKRPLSHVWPYAAGSLCSTARDLVAWNEALHRSTRVLGAAAYRDLLATDTLNDGTRLRYGKGLAFTPIHGHRAIHHGGGINGWTSSLLYFPDESLSVVVLYNTSGPSNPAEAAQAIARAVLGERPLTPVAIAGNPQRYVGSYAGNGRGGPQQMAIALEGNALVATVRGSRRPLVHLGNGVFAAEGTRFVFAEAGGVVTSVRVDGGSANNRLKREP
jgi:CubicO group peptidase (beta-lactamase class C family)